MSQDAAIMDVLYVVERDTAAFEAARTVVDVVCAGAKAGPAHAACMGRANLLESASARAGPNPVSDPQASVPRVIGDVTMDRERQQVRATKRCRCASLRCVQYSNWQKPAVEPRVQICGDKFFPKRDGN